MKHLVLALLIVFSTNCSNSNIEDDGDNEFFRKYIDEFPEDPIYRRPNWVLLTGHAEGGDVSMNIENRFGDTLITCSLRKFYDPEGVTYLISKRISYVNGHERHILNVENVADTLYHFIVDSAYHFSDESRYDTGKFIFLSRKYSFLYEDFYFDSCQSAFYRQNEDSLRSIKGNILPAIAGCKN